MTTRIPFTEDIRGKVLEKTDKHCHICHKALAKKNYGAIGLRGAWEIDHSIPISKGGTNHLNNLYPACIPCNRKKGNGNNTAVRKLYGVTVAPLSKQAKNSKHQRDTLAGLAMGAGFGSVFGPIGILVGATVGAIAAGSRFAD